MHHNLTITTLAFISVATVAVDSISSRIAQRQAVVSHHAGAAGTLAHTGNNGDQHARAFDWPGTYDLIGTGFHNGERFATMTVTRHDTSYSVSLDGPPGVLHSLRITGDSAQVVWDMREMLMHVHLVGDDDDLSGKWRIGNDSGTVFGTRRK